MKESARSSLSRRAQDWCSGTPLASIADTYIGHLTDRGYTSSTIDSYFDHMAHFASWLARRPIVLAEVNEAVVSIFLEKHLPRCRCARRYRRKRSEARAALSHLIALLRTRGQIGPAAREDSAAIAEELRDFDQHLTEVRGLTDVTRANRCRHIRGLLRDQFGTNPVTVGSLKPVDIAHFVSKYTQGWTPQSRNTVCGSLRSYLRYRLHKGDAVTGLIATVPKVASWRLARVPQVLSVAEVEQFFEAFDRNTSVGRRDYAIARCLVDLGLRAVEVSRLTLDDIDWRASSILIRGKTRRADLYPLPPDTGRAIAQYLRNGRPGATSRALFVRHRAPLDAPVTARIVRGTVHSTAERGGVAALLHGPHLLRHTAAQRLIERGATLKNIADFLRHRSLDTTTIYTKVDLRALSQVALPWLGRSP